MEKKCFFWSTELSSIEEGSDSRVDCLSILNMYLLVVRLRDLEVVDTFILVYDSIGGHSKGDSFDHHSDHRE